MIIRIATEGQYELSDDEVAELNELDNQAVGACEISDEASFRQAFNQLLAFVREHGHALSGGQPRALRADPAASRRLVGGGARGVQRRRFDTGLRRAGAAAAA